MRHGRDSNPRTKVLQTSPLDRSGTAPFFPSLGLLFYLTPLGREDDIVIRMNVQRKTVLFSLVFLIIIAVIITMRSFRDVPTAALPVPPATPTSILLPTTSPFPSIFSPLMTQWKITKTVLTSGSLKGQTQYQIPELELSFILPQELALVSEEDEDYVRNSMQIAPKTAIATGEPIGDSLYISVIPKNFKSDGGHIYNYRTEELTTLFTLQVGEKVNTNDLVPIGFIYQRLPDEKIAEQVTKKFINTNPWESIPGTSEYRYYVETEKNLYLFGAFVGGQQPTPYRVSETQFRNFLETILIGEKSH
jgi:hypothetical protein